MDQVWMDQIQIFSLVIGGDGGGGGGCDIQNSMHRLISNCKLMAKGLLGPS